MHGLVWIHLTGHAKGGIKSSPLYMGGYQNCSRLVIAARYVLRVLSKWVCVFMMSIDWAACQTRYLTVDFWRYCLAGTPKICRGTLNLTTVIFLWGKLALTSTEDCWNDGLCAVNGSIIPGASLANSSLLIAAMSERCITTVVADIKAHQQC